MGRITEVVKHLLIVNVLFFLATQFYGDVMYEYFALWFPKNENFAFWQILSHMFMHGGLMHIFFNMYALWAFGSPLEQIWGRNKFLFFYISAGLGAALIHTAVNYYYYNEGLQDLLSIGLTEDSVKDLLALPRRNVNPEYLTLYDTIRTPAVGASGAVYGILVAFGMMFPNSELFLIFIPFPIKAKYFIPILVGLDLFSGVTGYSIFGSNIAHFAHVGGALFGFIMMWYWKKNQFNKNRWDR
ncbi:rhomboid family intramembrane serine protease [Flavobacteriaceae bacterium M23B6Z8]